MDRSLFRFLCWLAFYKCDKDTKMVTDVDFLYRYSEMDRSTGAVLSYEAETLRADTKLVQPGQSRILAYQDWLTKSKID